LLTGDQLFAEVEAFLVGCGKDERGSPGGADGVKAHDESVGEDAGEDEVEDSYRKDAVEKNYELIVKGLPGWSFFRRGRRSVSYQIWQEAPLVLLWFAFPNQRNPWCREPR